MGDADAETDTLSTYLDERDRKIVHTRACRAEMGDLERSDPDQLETSPDCDRQLTAIDHG